MEETDEEVSNFEQGVQRLTHQDARREQDTVLEESEDKVSMLKQEVHPLTQMLHEKDEELQQLYMEIHQSTAATGEDQLVETEGITHLSMLQKMNIVARGVYLGLVVFFPTMLEVEQH